MRFLGALDRPEARLGVVVFGNAAAAAAAAARPRKCTLFQPARSRRGQISCLASPWMHFGPARLNPQVFLTSLGASINLVSAIGLVAWMQKSGYLPAETPVVLSQVAFRITIPCYLMSKVSAILATQGSPEMLLLPFLAVLQVVIGGALGRLFCVLLYGLPSSRGRSLPRSIAKKEALVTTACAFGNTLALPLVFLSGILPPKDVTLAAGYLALFMVGWSPALWTGAYAIIANSGGNHDAPGEKKLRMLESVDLWRRRIMNPPLCGVFIGMLVGLTPLSNVLISEKALAFSHKKLVFGLSRLLAPVYDAAQFLGSAAPTVQLTVLACSIAGVMRSRKANVPQPWGPRKIKSTLEDGSLLTSSTDGSPLISQKEFLAIYCVRSFLLPLVFSASLLVLEKFHLLKLDPVCRLTFQILSTMPSAQNLVLLAQLRPSTRPLAKEFANLLFKQYLAALVPITLWSALFLSSF